MMTSEEQDKIKEQNINHIRDCLARLLEKAGSYIIRYAKGYHITLSVTKEKVFEATAATYVCEAQKFRVRYTDGDDLKKIAEFLYMSSVEAINTYLTGYFGLY